MMRSHRFNPTHPRVCGEHVLARCRSRCAGDSPPRVRGAPDLGSADAGRIRLTPACAGSTSSLRDFLYRQPTHPRVCGEHGQGSPSRFTGIDSPPRVRGALAAARRRRYERRLTPACAGSTLNQRRRLSPSTTHPRVCGEHTLKTNRQFIPVDSPPRVRGARGFGASVLSQGRLTPACAGSTPPERPRRASQATHPRVCGEHRRASRLDMRNNDSPPRVRGARSDTRRSPPASRLTPACAGSTSATAVRGPSRTTHPRVCGEHTDRKGPLMTHPDSPPRVRGAPPRFVGDCDTHRLTPACAGSTRRRQRPSSGSPTHPRVCGEHGVCDGGDGSNIDSPPRVRGARPTALKGNLPFRLTPACAGSTSLP